MSNVRDKTSKALLEAATSPISLVPFVTGATGGIALLSFAAVASPYLLGLAGGAIVWGIGSAIFRTFSSNTIKEKVEKAILDEQEKLKQLEIEKIQNYLFTDGEKELLEDILVLQKLVNSSFTNSISDITRNDVLEKSRELLDCSYNSLLKIPAISEYMKVLKSSKDAVQKLRTQRASLINGVKDAVNYVSIAMADLQSLGSQENNQEEIRDQLSKRLGAAKELDGALSSIPAGFSPEMLAQYRKASRNQGV